MRPVSGFSFCKTVLRLLEHRSWPPTLDGGGAGCVSLWSSQVTDPLPGEAPSDTSLQARSFSPSPEELLAFSVTFCLLALSDILLFPCIYNSKLSMLPTRTQLRMAGISSNLLTLLSLSIL